jgi:serine/threonine-protein kinase
MIDVRLPHGVWKYDPNAPLGRPGGFGAVFAGAGEGQAALAVKRLHLTASEAAHRELRIAEELTNRHLTQVMPILDAGQDAESDFYFVVMFRAETNLQDKLRQIGDFAESETIDILQQISAGLTEVSDIVHRDLKPANILFHEGRWKIADFGIARFVEESTSLETLKSCLTPPYAAPEQWLLERATHATDIYALGCIAYALLTGLPPFPGPSSEDYREQHLSAEPPALSNKQPQLRALVASMLRKTPQGRPSLERVSRLLADIVADSAKGGPSKGFLALAQAGATDAEASARAEASRMTEAKLMRERQAIADGAFQMLHELADLFYERMHRVVPTIERIDARSRMEVLHAKFGAASIQIEMLNHGNPIPKNAFQKSGWDVIVGTKIQVLQEAPKRYVWGANLWYTNLGSSSEYRWWEVPYWTVYPRGHTPYYLVIAHIFRICGETGG